MFRYVCSILLIVMSLQAHAQDRIPNDSSKYRFLPTGIRIGTDLISIAKPFFTDRFKGWEINADADIYRRYYLAADFGSWTGTYDLGNDKPGTHPGTYSTSGRYFRFGLDINFLLKDPDRNMLFVGVRRAHSSYSDHVDFSYMDDALGRMVYQSVANESPKANWNELTMGLRIKVWKFIWMGATTRLKFGLQRKGQDDLLSYEVPGYGRTFKTSWYGINYTLLFRIPVREDVRQSITLK